MSVDELTPIIIGAGQTVSHWTPESDAPAPSPVGLCVEAAQRAMNDTLAAPALASIIDVLTVVRAMSDSIPGAPAPFGRSENPPGTVARLLGLTPERAIYSAAGGEQPQSLVNECAQSLHRGEAKAALLCGGEATAAMKAALKAQYKLDWSDDATGGGGGNAGADFEDRGFGEPLITAYEIINGLGLPMQTYPVFEQALRRRLGMDRSAWREMMSVLMARFSAIAANNPYAQFPAERSADFLSTPSSENYPTAEPYLKWHVAQDAVNQGAAIILTTVKTARACGVPEEKWIYLYGYGQGIDRFVSERADLSHSRPMQWVLARALEIAGIAPRNIDHFDIYSCFPCVVFLAAEYLELDWREKDLTVTGGLPFFGGAGNNYSMHAIASMVETLRAKPAETGLVLANGGFMTKFAAGVYSARPAHGWRPASDTGLYDALGVSPSLSPALLAEDTQGDIVSYSITHDRNGPSRGFVIVENENGRAIANIPDTDQDGKAHTGQTVLEALVKGRDPLGRKVRIIHKNGANYMLAPNRSE